MIDVFISISGLDTWEFSSSAGGAFPHSIVSIGQLQSTLDPLEPIVDSSPFSVVLAADAVYQDGRTTYLDIQTVRSFFLRPPGNRMALARNYIYGDQYIYTTDEADGSICIGACTYDTVLDGWQGDVCVSEIYPNSPAGQISNHYIDTDLGIAPTITDRPIVWKGRFVFIYLGSQSNQNLYRVCYLTDNPVFGLNTVELRMAPIDARIRDHHAAPLTPSVGHFATSDNRQYVRGQRVKRIVGYASDGGPELWMTGSASVSSYTFNSSTITYTGLNGTIQTVTTVPGGVPLEGNNNQRIWTPASPALFRSAYGWIGITGWSSGTASFNVSIYPGEGLSASCQPAIRFYTTNNVSQQPAYSLRQAIPSYSTTYRDPNFSLQVGDENGYTVNWQVSAAALTNIPAPSICLIWRQNEPDNSYHGNYTTWSFAGAIRNEWAGKCPNAASVKGDSGLTWLMLNELDVYSVRPLTQPTHHLDFSVHSWKRTGSGLSVKVHPVTEHCASYKCDPSTSIALAQATAWWCPGEQDIVLDSQFCQTGNSVWLNAEWTEDGSTYFTRRFKATLIDEPNTGVFRYEVGEGLRQDGFQVDCAGIGDWFGFRASFTVDTTVEQGDDSTLIYLYMVPSAMFASASLFIDASYVDYNELMDHAHRLSLINTWRFADPQALDENLAAMLALNGTCLTFRSQGGYKLTRKWTGAPSKTESYVEINDDILLETPTATIDDEIVSDYKITFANEQTVTYSDRVAKALFNAEKTFELDLSSCPINTGLSNADLARGMLGELMTLVDRFGSERQIYDLVIPFEEGRDLTPGDVIRLSSDFVIGQIGAGYDAKPSNLLCRVLDVTQDLMNDRTSLKVRAETKTVGQYQAGARILDGWGTTTLTIDDATWVADGMTVSFGNMTAAISSHTGTTITFSSAPATYSAFVFATTLDTTRFRNGYDFLG